MEEISIEIKLANRKYPLRVKGSESDAVQRAADLVNRKMKDFEEKYQVKDIQDLFAMTALQLATQWIDTKDGYGGMLDEVSDKISSLEVMLDHTLAST